MELPPPSKEQCVMKRQEYYEDIPPVAPVMRREDYMGCIENTYIYQHLDELDKHCEITGKSFVCNKKDFIKMFYDQYPIDFIKSLSEDYNYEIILWKPKFYIAKPYFMEIDEIIWSVKTEKFISKEFDIVRYKQYHKKSLFSKLLHNII